MAVYTHLSADTLEHLIAEYDVGTLRSAKGIAEGVSNSNWLIETDRGRFILTMFERRIELGNLPYFLALLDHLSAHGCPVPQTIHDRTGASYRFIDGKAVALIEFLPGVSIDQPTSEQAHNVGMALAQIHNASADFEPQRANDLGPTAWGQLFDQCGVDALADIDPSLPDIVQQHVPEVQDAWPTALPDATTHTDLFPDNVLMLGNRVSGLIDFYFACTDFAAYDLAVTHAAWCFAEDGRDFCAEIGDALIGGYKSVRPLTDQEWAALPVLTQGAAIRFMATRAVDWIETPDSALVRRKDPMDFARRLLFYRKHGGDLFTALPNGSATGPAAGA